jgi:hypothetical protein
MERTTTTIAATALALLLTACAGSPARMALEGPEGYAKADNRDLCRAVYYGKSIQARDELNKRGALTQREWDAAVQGKVFIGMSELAAVCAWGLPTKVNSTVTGYGSGEQWVYGKPSQYNKPNYLYMTGGRVAAVQQ